jgi:hypothetical protein
MRALSAIAPKEAAMMRTSVLAAAFLFVVLGGVAATAQESRGSIAGLVADSSNGALPGVTVTIANTGTNATVTQVTNSTGQYSVLFLLPGTYTVSVQLDGFQKISEIPLGDGTAYGLTRLIPGASFEGGTRCSA